MYNKNCLIISDAFIAEVRNKIPEVKNLTDADIKATISANQTKEGEIPSIDVLKKASVDNYTDILMPVITLIVIAVICTGIAIKTFRWE